MRICTRRQLTCKHGEEGKKSEEEVVRLPEELSLMWAMQEEEEDRIRADEGKWTFQRDVRHAAFFEQRCGHAAGRCVREKQSVAMCAQFVRVRW